MTISIFYFSGTGNTWWVADNLGRQLNEYGHKVGLYSIEQIQPSELTLILEDSQYILLGFPVYGSTAPQPMIDFIEAFPPTENKKSLGIFATHAMASGDSAHYIGSCLKEKGYDLMLTRHFVMMNNFHIPTFRFYRPRNDSRLDKRLDKTLPQALDFVEEIHSLNRKIRGNNFLGHFLGNTQRFHIRKVLETLGELISIDQEKCIQCGKCERICPTKNIVKSDSFFSFGNSCAVCLRCYSQCPVSAILMGKGSENIVRFPRYKGPGKDFKIDVLTRSKEG